MITLLINKVGHQRVARFLSDHAPLGMLNVLTAQQLGRLSTVDLRLHTTPVTQITVGQIMDAIKASESVRGRKCQKVQ